MVLDRNRRSKSSVVLVRNVGAIPRHSDSVKASQAFLVVHVCMHCT